MAVVPSRARHSAAQKDRTKGQPATAAVAAPAAAPPFAPPHHRSPLGAPAAVSNTAKAVRKRGGG